MPGPTAAAGVFGLLLAGIATLAGASAPEHDPAVSAGRLPRMEVRTLSGERVVLPDSVTGPGVLLAFAFRRQDQKLVDSWLPWTGRIASTGCEFYEVALLGQSVPRILRGLVFAGMRAAVPRHLHANLVPYYGDVDRLAEALAMHDRTTAHVLLVARDGRVVRRVQGRADTAKAGLMVDACRELGAVKSGR